MSDILISPNNIINIDNSINKVKVYLAGSHIFDWRKVASKKLKQMNTILLYPNERITDWELSGLEMSDIVFFYYHPDDGPSLLELGLIANVASDNKQSVVVCCPLSYANRSDVVNVCKRYSLTLLDDFDKAVIFVASIIERRTNE